MKIVFKKSSLKKKLIYIDPYFNHDQLSTFNFLSLSLLSFLVTWHEVEVFLVEKNWMKKKYGWKKYFLFCPELLFILLRINNILENNSNHFGAFHHN